MLSLTIFFLFTGFIVSEQIPISACVRPIVAKFVNVVPTGAIIVPDDYPTIQSAIGNASTGETVFVKKGNYYCGPSNEIVIDKSISLVGEDANATIINGRYEYYNLRPSGYSTIKIEASNVLITGFTMTNCEYAIEINPNGWGNFSNITIKGNIIVNNHGAVIDSGIKDDTVVISSNIIQNCSTIALKISANNTIVSGNIMIDNHISIIANTVKNAKISGNFIDGDIFGILLYDASNVFINNNNITGCLGYDSITQDFGYGIEFRSNCNHTLIFDNNIHGNSHGINVSNIKLKTDNLTRAVIPQGFDNFVYSNNFFDNTQNVNIEHIYPNKSVGVINGTLIVSWDNGSVGNYWADYASKYPNATESSALGIGNIPYSIDANNSDNYPLMQQVNITLGIPSTINSSQINSLTIGLIAIFAVIVSIAIVLIVKRKKR